MFVFFLSSRRRHTRCALGTGVQTCALPICSALHIGAGAVGVTVYPEACAAGEQVRQIAGERWVDRRTPIPRKCGPRMRQMMCHAHHFATRDLSEISLKPGPNLLVVGESIDARARLRAARSEDAAVVVNAGIERQSIVSG